MSSREEFEAWWSSTPILRENKRTIAEKSWQASRAHESDLLAALQAITNSGPDAIPIKEAFEMAHMAIERANGGRV
jgi:hypothetical protein